MDSFEGWQGGGGIIRKVGSGEYPYKVEITEVPPTNNAQRVGNKVDMATGWLRPVEKPAEDVVNHPSHYTQYPVEVIELTEHMDFCRGNAVKYLARAGHKDPAKELEDLKKSLWYVQRAISKLEKEQT
jgi:hypothetical protein